MVERTEREHDADRLVVGECQAASGSGVAVHRDFDARLAPQVLGREADAVDRPIRLDQGIRERFSAFAGGLQGQLVPLLLHNGRGAPEDFDPPGRPEPGVPVAEEGVGRRQGTLDAGAVHLLDRGDRRTIERRGNHRRLAGRRGAGDH